MYTVRRLADPRTVTDSTDTQISAWSHREAAQASGLATPGAILIVEEFGTTIRYLVDSLGRIVEQSSYNTGRR